METKNPLWPFAIGSVFDNDDQYDADDDAHQDDTEDEICCPACNGSGEGMTDGSTCSSCKGRGELRAR